MVFTCLSYSSRNGARRRRRVQSPRAGGPVSLRPSGRPSKRSVRVPLLRRVRAAAAICRGVMPFFSCRSSTGFHGLPGPEAFGGSPGLMWPRPVWKSTSVSGAPSSRRRVDGVEDGAMIQHERAVKF